MSWCKQHWHTSSACKQQQHKQRQQKRDCMPLLLLVLYLISSCCCYAYQHSSDPDSYLLVDNYNHNHNHNNTSYSHINGNYRQQPKHQARQSNDDIAATTTKTTNTTTATTSAGHSASSTADNGGNSNMSATHVDTHQPLLLIIHDTSNSSGNVNNINNNDSNSDNIGDDSIAVAYSLPVWEQITWILMFMAMIAVAAGGNLIVIYIVFANHEMKSVTNYFLVNLSLADTMVSTLNVIFNFTGMLTGNWPFGDTYCRISNFIAILSIAASVFTLTAISCDRYNAIIHPLKPRMSQRSALGWVLAIWTLSVALGAPNLIYSSVVELEANKSICTIGWPDGLAPVSSYDHIYNVIVLIVTYIVPIVTMAVLYYRVGRELWGSETIGEDADKAQQKGILAKKKIVKMMIVVVSIFALCWLPYHVVFVASYYFPGHVDQRTYLFMYWLAMSNSMYNPIIIYFMNSKFRRAFQTVFCNCCGLVKNSSPSDQLRNRVQQYTITASQSVVVHRAPHSLLSASNVNSNSSANSLAARQRSLAWAATRQLQHQQRVGQQQNGALANNFGNNRTDFGATLGAIKKDPSADDAGATTAATAAAADSQTLLQAQTQAQIETQTINVMSNIAQSIEQSIVQAIPTTTTTATNNSNNATNVNVSVLSVAATLVAKPLASLTGACATGVSGTGSNVAGDPNEPQELRAPLLRAAPEDSDAPERATICFKSSGTNDSTIALPQSQSQLTQLHHAQNQSQPQQSQSQHMRRQASDSTASDSMECRMATNNSATASSNNTNNNSNNNNNNNKNVVWI